ncbi:hypothetical protein [Streptomyces sp. N35]|uniref:hypothetical protein n=1 Tax=Streptomyces sp. N35 TaxID=2795730 RepID=UPI0018F5EBC1|nr:hypothetical protein [Streptomyces sp. N35]
MTSTQHPVSRRVSGDHLFLTLLIGSYLAMAAGALLPSYWVFTLAVLVSYSVDFLLPHAQDSILARLRQSRFGLTIRFTLREMMLLGFLAYGVSSELREVAGFTIAALLILFAAQLLYAMGMRYIAGQHRALPVTVRALDLSEFIPPPLPPNILYRKYVRKLLYMDIPAVLGLLVSVPTSSTIYATLGAVLTAGAAIGALLAILPQILRAHSIPSREDILFAVNRAVDLHRPQVAIYFSFAAVSKDFMYQVNMWLETMEVLPQSAVIILRERASMDLLAPTSIPVVCVPKADDLAEIKFPHLRVALYPGNAGKNVHMLQRAEVKHVFIGHGDSDKLASSNRASKIYDEVWVAGAAGRARYARVRTAIRDKDIVEVGRPQLAPVQSWLGEGIAHPTVLYAPTWEGWTSDADYSSAVVMGERLVRTLLEANPQGRIIYRPHPLLGFRSPDAAAAHRAILNLLDQDNALRHADSPDLKPDPELLHQMGRLQGRIDILLDRGRDSPAYRLTEEERVVRLRAAYEKWHQLFRQAYSGNAHYVSTGRLPSVFECFNHADVMISDISSVVSDFVASGKPYALTNPRSTPTDEYLAQNSVAGAAYLLTPDLSALPNILEAVRNVDADYMGSRRDTLRSFLLGEEYQNSTMSFTDATDRLLARGFADFPVGTLAEPITASPFTSDASDGAVALTEDGSPTHVL